MDLLKLDTLGGIKTAFLSPKRYDEHPRFFLCICLLLLWNGTTVHLLAQRRVSNIPSKLLVEIAHALRTFLVVLVATNNERQNQGAISTIKLLPKFQPNVHIDPLITPPAVFTYSSNVLHTTDKCFKIIATEAKEC